MLPTQSWDCPRQLTLAEQLALQHFRNHAPRAVVETCKQKEEKKDRRLHLARAARRVLFASISTYGILEHFSPQVKRACSSC